MNFTLDTFVWIEYFEGSKSGEVIKQLLEDGIHNLFTPSIALAELSDAVVKGKVRADWSDVIRFVALNTHIKEIDSEIAGESGIIKNNLRKKHPNFGLIDAIVLATARKLKSLLLTGDEHLTGEADVIDIKKEDYLGKFK